MIRRGALVPALLGLLALAAGCRTPADDPGTPAPVDPAAIYGRFCARCHGDDGKGDTEMGKRMKIPDLTGPGSAAMPAAAVEQIISNGRGQMPGFGNMTTPPKIQAMAGHVRRLATAAGGTTQR